MNIEQIESFLHKKTTEENSYVKISFKKRDAVYGLFVKDRDYADLKSKNFWRIVTRSHFDNYNKTKTIIKNTETQKDIAVLRGLC